MQRALLDHERADGTWEDCSCRRHVPLSSLSSPGALTTGPPWWKATPQKKRRDPGRRHQQQANALRLRATSAPRNPGGVSQITSRISAVPAHLMAAELDHGRGHGAYPVLCDDPAGMRVVTDPSLVHPAGPSPGLRPRRARQWPAAGARRAASARHSRPQPLNRGALGPPRTTSRSSSVASLLAWDQSAAGKA